MRCSRYKRYGALTYKKKRIILHIHSTFYATVSKLNHTNYSTYNFSSKKVTYVRIYRYDRGTFSYILYTYRYVDYQRKCEQWIFRVHVIQENYVIPEIHFERCVHARNPFHKVIFNEKAHEKIRGKITRIARVVPFTMMAVPHLTMSTHPI